MNLDVIDNVDVAPTLAELLGLTWRMSTGECCRRF